MIKTLVAGAALAVLLLGPLAAGAAVLDATTSLNALTNDIPLAGGTQDVSANGSGVYDFNDKNGDDTTGDAVTPAGLSMGSERLTSDDGTDILLDLNGGDIAGDSGVTALDTQILIFGNGTKAGDVAITNVGAIAMGGIQTSQTGTGQTGAVDIGTLAARAGSVRVDFINTSQYSTSNNNGNATGGITVYSSGNVLIQTSGLAAGDLDTTNASANAGSVNVNHDGAFTARDIITTTPSTWTAHNAGGVTLEGDGLSNGASGALNVRTIDARVLDTSWGNIAGSIHISGYTSVHVTGDLLSGNETSTGGGVHETGDITIEDIAGNVTVDGVINANAADAADVDGTLSITAGGVITLASLDLLLVDSATFDAGGGTYITGALENFSTASPGDGILDTPGGQTVYYDPAVGSNAYLGGLTYTLASGGELAPVPEPATLALLGLGGLATAGSAVRRRRR